MNTRARDLLLPIVFLPLIIPLLIAATSAHQRGIFADGAGLGSLAGKLAVPAGVRCGVPGAAYGTYDFAIGE